MKRKHKITATVMLILGLVATGVIVMYEREMVFTRCDSNLLWNDDQALLVVGCSEGHFRVTVPSQIKAWIQLRRHAATNAIPITVQNYIVIYHVKAGKLRRFQIDDPGNLQLTPWNGHFFFRGTDSQKHLRVWEWHDDVLRPLSDETTARIRREMPVGYSEAVKQQGWFNEMDFAPGAFKGPEKQKVLRLRDCTVRLKISKSKAAVTFLVSVDGQHPSTCQDEFIREPRALSR